ncbi:MAG TPA: prepilin-type N-terminal cleavage/methylation domain-containing protein [Thermoanaerobaculia bacterium]|jgi:type II secretory pathway pseudopilin PulG
MSASRFHRPGQRGFTLVEVAVSLIVTVVVLLGVLALFDFSNKLTRAQTNISDMQQSLRVAQADSMRLIRMAGRGGIPVGNLPTGMAVGVQNNVVDGTKIGGGATPDVVPGSDVLTIRGVLTSSVYQINQAALFELKPSAAAPTTGSLHVANPAPSGVPQDLTAIIDAIKPPGRPEGLVLVARQDPSIWVVVELDPGNSDASNPSDVKVGFKVTGGHTADYLKLSSSPGSYPTNLTSAVSVGIVEEYRFYVRREYAVAGDNTSDLIPKLSRARVYPNTQSAWGGDDKNWQVDIADNIFDLQVALGLDTAAKDPGAGACGAGTIASDDINCGIYESADGENDDWMYNGEKNTNSALFANSDLYYIRLTTLARTDRRDKDYQAPVLERVEDNTYDTTDTAVFNSTNERMYRRRLLRTVIDMRNLG